MKRTLTFALLLFCSLISWADKQPNDTIEVRGEVVDNFTREVVDSVFMEVLMPDSTTVVDTLWNLRHNKMKGGWWGDWEVPGYNFKLARYGNYLLRCTKRGYKPSITTLNIPRKHYNKKVREWENDPILLKKSSSYDFDTEMGEVTVTATRIKMLQDGDTVVYNADAFELSEGSMLDELIRQLPGVELRDGGEIYVNGHKVDELMLNGKHFFKGDAKVALDNLPAYMVQNVKAYQRADEKAYLDKHHEEMKKKDPWVIDVNLKRQYNQGWIGNAEGGWGPHLGSNDAKENDKGVYIGRLFLTRFTDHSRLTIFANANNTSTHSHPGQEGSWSDWSSPTGEADVVSGGIEFHVDSKEKKTTFDTSLNAQHTKTRNETVTSSTTFLEGGDVFGRSRNNDEQTSTNVNWNAHLEIPKKNTYFDLTPSFGFTHNKSTSFGRSATFTADPIDHYRGESLDLLFQPLGSARLDSILTNRSLQNSLGTTTTYSPSINASLYTVAPWNGERIDFSVRASHNRTDSESFSHNDLRQGTERDFRNQYSLSPSRSTNINVSFSHGIYETKIGTIEMSYSYNYAYNNGHRSLYRLDKYADSWGADTHHEIGSLPSTTDSLNAVIDIRNSYHTLTRDHQHLTGLSMSKGGDWGFYYIAASIQHSRNHIEDTRDTHKTLTRRFNLPQVYGFAKIKDWDINFNYNQAAPQMSYLLDIRDDSNPLNISEGNAHLKNSSSEGFGLNYSHANMEKQRNWRSGLTIGLQQNSVANAMSYNRKTGVYKYRPENISGNWNANLNGSFDIPLDKQKLLTLKNMTNLIYNHNVDYASEMTDTQDDGQTAEVTQTSTKSTVHNYTANDQLELVYQKGNYRASLVSSADYTHATSTRANFMTINTVDFSYGATCALKLPWNFQLDMDLTMHSRRGYEDETMNDNNLVWNAALSKSVLKNKALTLKLIGHDILQQLSNVRRTVNAQGRTETWYNTQPAYCLFTLSYKLNVMPKKKQQ